MIITTSFQVSAKREHKLQPLSFIYCWCIQIACTANVSAGALKLGTLFLELLNIWADIMKVIIIGITHFSMQ